MLARWSLVVALSMVACGSRDNDKAGRQTSEPPVANKVEAKPVDGPPPAEEKHVFDVKSSADLLSLRSEYMRLWDSGFDGTLEVNIAAGSYTPQNWELFPASDSNRKGAAPTIDVVLRGAPAVVPLPSRMRVRKLRIERLVLAGASAPWTVEVADELTISRSMVIDGRGRTFDEGAPHVVLLGYGAGGKPSPVRARFESSWFVRNWQDQTDQQMIGFSSSRTAQSYWDSIAIDDCVFANNAFAVSLDFEFAKAVTITNSLFYKPWPSGVIFKSTSSGDIVIDDSVIISDKIDHIAAHGAESPPIKLGAGTRVYVGGWKAGTKPPATLVADPAQIHDRAALGAGEQELATAGAMPATAMPADGLKATLDKAARP